MAQSAIIEVNGVSNADAISSGKRKRDASDEGDVDMNGTNSIEEEQPSTARQLPKKNQRALINSYYEVLKSIDIEQPILELRLLETESSNEPQAKRQKSAEPNSLTTIHEKIVAEVYNDLDDVATDILSLVKASLSDLAPDNDAEMTPDLAQRIAGIKDFRDRAMQILQREQSYGRPDSESRVDVEEQDTQQSEMILSVFGHAPQERRLFSSLPISKKVDLSEVYLPVGVSISRVMPSNPKEEHVQTLGELFGPLRPQPPLQAPKPPRNQAKGTKLDFYHPELTDRSTYPGNNYFTTNLSAGHYLDYSQATPVSPTRTRQHERAQSLAGKKPSEEEAKTSEMEALFRGAFSSFAPCRDDSAALVPSGVAGRLWWQRGGSHSFQRMIEVGYLSSEEEEGEKHVNDIDEAMIKEVIEHWDDHNVDPSLDDAMGAERADEEKEIDDILDEVSNMIETLASIQRIRNLNLPTSHNRPGSEPVGSDMMTNPVPKPTEEEIATYQMLKAQLALIVKTLPPFAVAKLNGDQLDELLISTRVQVSSEQYKGIMEEDESGVQARIRAEQQVAQASPRQQRTPSVVGQYPNHPQQPNPYGTPSRPPSHHHQQLQQQQQPYYRPGATPTSYQQPRQQYTPAQQPRPPQPTQYNRTNGYPNQYATQLAKAQTPYGHQNMPQFAGQQRPQYGHMPPQGSPQVRHPSYQQGYPQQGMPPQGYNGYTNGSGLPPRQMSPQMNRQGFTPTANTPQQPHRYGTPSQMQSQMNRFQAHPQPHQSPAPHSQSPGIVGYHTVISEAQQQRILDQAKARVAAQERSASFGDKMGHPSLLAGSQLGARSISMGTMPQLGGPRTPTPGSSGQAHARPPMNGGRMTPVPLPTMPGQQPSGATGNRR